jgi:hypothetical protein
MCKKKKKDVKKFRKKFNTRVIRIKQTYSTDEIAIRLNVHISTVHAWYKTGLATIDNHNPHRVFGQDLIDFLKLKNTKRKRPCNLEELFCCKCQKPNTPRDNIVCIMVTKARTNIMGRCKSCGSKINKAISPLKIDDFKKIFTVLTVHEEDLIECANTCAITKKKQRGNND